MKRQCTRKELVEHWTLAPEELALLANKRGATRLGFALLLKASLLEGLPDDINACSTDVKITGVEG